MTDSDFQAIVGATVRSGIAVFEKSASANAEQSDILGKTWPSEGENLTKKAQLSRILATGHMVEESSNG